MPTELQAALLATWPAIRDPPARPLDAAARRRRQPHPRGDAAGPDEPTDREIAEAEAAMRAWNQRPLFQLAPGDAALDAALAARGYRIRDPTLLLAGPVAALAAPGGEVASLRGAARRDAGDLGRGRHRARAWSRHGPGARAAALPARPGGRPLAGAAFVAIHRRIAMLSALEVAARARQGLAGRMVGAAAARAAAGRRRYHGAGGPPDERAGNRPLRAARHGRGRRLPLPRRRRLTPARLRPTAGRNPRPAPTAKFRFPDPSRMG